MPFVANSCVHILMNVTFYAKTLIELDKNVNEGRLIKMIFFLFFEFEVRVNYSIFSGNELQKV